MLLKLKIIVLLTAAFSFNSYAAMNETEVAKECFKPIDLLMRLQDGSGNPRKFSIWDIPIALDVAPSNPSISEYFAQTMLAQDNIQIRNRLDLPVVFKDLDDNKVSTIGWKISDCAEKTIVFTRVLTKNSKAELGASSTLKIKIVKDNGSSGELEILENYTNYFLADSPHSPLKYGGNTDAKIQRKLMWNTKALETVELPVKTLALLSLASARDQFNHAIVQGLNMMPAGSCVNINGSNECYPLKELFDFRKN